MFVLFCVVKDILCTRNPLVLIFLRILKCCIQLALSGHQDIEQRRWVFLICDFTLWFLTGVSSYKYLLFINLAFLIQNSIFSNYPKQSQKSRGNLSQTSFKNSEKLKIHHWKCLGKEEPKNSDIGVYWVISDKVLEKSVSLWGRYGLKQGNFLQNFGID